MNKTLFIIGVVEFLLGVFADVIMQKSVYSTPIYALAACQMLVGIGFHILWGRSQ